MQFIINILNFLNDALLKMTWLETLIKRFLDFFRLEETSYFYAAISFYLYDVIKIFILLSVLIYLSSLIQARFTPEKTKALLTKMKGVKGNVVGALLGTVTPFCSCSSIPIFIGFTKAQLPIGVTFSFLISSPLVDLASTILLASIFGWKAAIAYVLFGIIIAVIGGVVIDKLNMEKEVKDFVREGPSVETITYSLELSRKERHVYAKSQVQEIIKKVWIYILIGVLIGAIIHGYIPQDLVELVLGKNNSLAVLIATVIGIPMYADIFGTLPIAQALVGKGVEIGTVLAFMMAVTALSLPSIVLLKQVVKTKLLLVFVFIVVIGIILTGYIFNIYGYLLM